MRDLIFVGYLASLFLLAFRRPFLFAMIYLYIDIVAPQRLSYFLLNSVPISIIAFGFAVIGAFVDDRKLDARFTWRQGAIVFLFFYCGYMTYTGAVSPLAALDKWSWVSKSLIFAAFLPFLLHKKFRFEVAILTYVLCASALIVTGGIKTAATGGGNGYGTLVILIDDNSGLYESSIISLVAIAIIPLILWLVKYGTIFRRDWKVDIYAGCLIFACLLIPVGTQARTGLVCIAVLAVLLLRFSKRRFLYLGMVVGVGLMSVPFLPTSFTDRMATITDPKADQSASTRLAVWAWTWDFVKQNPMGGGFDSFRINKISFELNESDKKPSTELLDDTSTGPVKVEDEARAFHNSYFEMLGEHGFLGLALWLFIFAGTIIRLELIRRRYDRRAQEGEEWVAPLANALQNFLIIFMVGANFVGIAFQPFPLGIAAIAIAFDTYLKRREREQTFRPIASMMRRKTATA